MIDNSPPKLTFVLGTAAELIKLYPVARLARQRGLRIHFLATGQSRQNFLAQYRDFFLDESELTWLIRGGADLENSGGALRWLAKALVAVWWRKDLIQLTADSRIVVHGDTLSTLVGALFGRRHHLNVIHVEAGLRSSSIWNPFPEELVRRLVSRFVHVHMVPDRTAQTNLVEAGVSGTIVNTGGNTLADCVALSPPKGEGSKRFALANIHRFENINSSERWKIITDLWLKVVQKIPLVVVLHPQTHHRLARDPALRERLVLGGVEFRDRLPFAEFIHLAKGADFLLSDGGSNQEECSYLGIPCLLLRQTTERIEGLGESCVLSQFNSAVIEDFVAEPSSYRRKPRWPEHSPSALIVDYFANGQEAR